MPILAALVFVAAAQETVVSGVVSLKGDAPARKAFNAPTEREKAAFPRGIFYESVLLDPEKRIRNAVVFVKSGLEGKTFPISAEPKRLDVEGFQLTPRAMGIMAGQELVVTNKDDGILHAVHSIPKLNKEFNTGMPAKGMSFKAAFEKPEAVRVKTECTHDWERAWIVVLPHPFHGATDGEGRYEIKGLPPGKYSIQTWQESCGPVVQEIELKAGEKKSLDFTLEARLQAHLFITGRVQGVGFRASTEAEAKRIGGLVGWVKNLDDGRVEAIVQGPPDQVEKLVRWCQHGPSSAEVKRVERSDEPPDGEFKTFEIRLF